MKVKWYELFIFRNNEKVIAGFGRALPGEILTNWLARKAFDHGLSLKRFWCQLFPGYHGSLDVDITIGETHVQKLAEIMNTAPQDVRATTYCYDKNRRKSQTHTVGLVNGYCRARTSLNIIRYLIGIARSAWKPNTIIKKNGVYLGLIAVLSITACWYHPVLIA